jgi:hypothetical protein
MTRKIEKGREKNKGGRPISHGSYSLISKDKILAEHPSLKRYLRAFEAGMIKHLEKQGPISTPQFSLVDLAVSDLAIIKGIQIYTGRVGIIDRGRLEREKTLALTPVLADSFLSYQNALRRTLVLLGIKLEDVEMPLVLRLLEQETESGKVLTAEVPEEDGDPEDGGGDGRDGERNNDNDKEVEND